jgi:acetoin utilization deacetylase AcuC-like enzyme
VLTAGHRYARPVPAPEETNAPRTGIVLHERYYWHDPGPSAGTQRPDGVIIQSSDHAEHPDTKRRLHGLLAATGYLDRLHQLAPRVAEVDELTRFHTREHITRVEVASVAGYGNVGREAFVGAGTYDIARLAVGGALVATDAVATGRLQNAYALVRPPGHHAEADMGMGFCYFNNVALAAMHARAVHGVGRIAIVDWDVHHGNGTQAAFYDDPNVLTISVHQDGRYPGRSGALDERGENRGIGANINIPLPPGSGHGAYTAVADRVIAPALDRFQPEFVFIASGFDAGGYDPMAHMMCHSKTFAYLADVVLHAAAHHAGGRVVAVHEGGYSAFHVPFCGLAVIERMAGQPSGVADPYIGLERLPYQDLQVHQSGVIDQAAVFVNEIPH